MTVTGMTKLCKHTLFFAFLVQKLEISGKNLNKSIILFQCLGLFDFQYFAPIENMGHRADKLSVCIQYSTLDDH